MLTDKDTITFGAHKGKALANVPADYLIWIHENYNLPPDLRAYIKKNMEVLKAEVARARREERR